MSEEATPTTRRSLRRSLLPCVDTTASSSKEAKPALKKESNQQEEVKPNPLPEPQPATKKACKYKSGSLVEVRDASKVWYKSRIVEIDESNRRAKVHYLGWNSRYDQWYDLDSPDMRLSKEAKSYPISAPNTSATIESQSGGTDSLDSKMQVGSKAMAKWKDEFYYPCLITRVLFKNDVKYYQIKFYDNVRKMVRLNNLREATQEELDTFPVIESGKKSTPDESKPTKTEHEEVNPKPDEEEERQRRAEAELLLAIQQPVVSVSQDDVEPEKAQPELQVESAEVKETSAQPATAQPTKVKADQELSSRKSLRVKRLRTYTEEIVFDSPASSIAYNLASVHNKSNLTSTSSSTSNAKRLKTSVSSQPAAEQTQTIKDQNRSTVQGYFKSLKSLNKSLSNPVSTTPKKAALKPESVQPTSVETPVRPEAVEEKKLKKKKKLKKDKKRLFEKLIENSKKQLRHQQELIEKQLKKHEHKKSQKKMAKLLKKQQKRQEMEQQQSQLFGQALYFESNEAILNQLIQQSRLLEMSQQHQQQQHQQPAEVSVMAAPTARTSVSNEPICCTVENCMKTFRKQHLLEYHLKYHHYLNADTAADGLSKTTSASSMTSAVSTTTSSATAPKRRRLSSSGNTTLNKKLSKLTSLSSSLNLTGEMNASNNGNELPADENEADFIGDLIGLNDDSKTDPYEVIHCRCGNHTSTGFMIQCDTCLCWQHGDCVNIKKGESVPKNYSCWVCNEPDNKLKGLKYKNWLNIRLEKEILTKIENLDHSTNNSETINNKSTSCSSSSSKNQLEAGHENQNQNDEYNKLCLLNECSRKFYNLNTLMYTLEYQISLFNQLVDNLSKKCSAAAASSTPNVNIDAEFDAEEQMATKISLNIEHLQDCLTKKFEQFNSKLDEFERKFPDDAKNSVSSKFNNLKQLYKQFETIVKS